MTGVHTGIFVAVSPDGDGFTRESLIAIARARELADLMGARVSALAPYRGELALGTLIHHGADVVVTLGDEPPLPASLGELVGAASESLKPELVLFPGDATGELLALGASGRLDAPLMGPAATLSLDEASRTFIVETGRRGGTLRLKCESKPVLVLLDRARGAPPFPDESRTGHIEKAHVLPQTPSHVRISEGSPTPPDTGRRGAILVGADAREASHPALGSLAASLGSDLIVVGPGLAPGIGAKLARLKPDFVWLVDVPEAFDVTRLLPDATFLIVSGACGEPAVEPRIVLRAPAAAVAEELVNLLAERASGKR